MTPKAERLAFHNGRPCWGEWYRAVLGNWHCDHAHYGRALALSCARQHAEKEAVA